ncbi:MAG: hypothetical protein AAF468_04955 [Pseudomonadota bacterium]
MLKILFIAAATSNFSAYPGFNNPNAMVEMTTDKGLVVEIVLRCGITDLGKISPGIMTYSKVERLFCSSKHKCFDTAEQAAIHTCNW